VNGYDLAKDVGQVYNSFCCWAPYLKSRLINCAILDLRPAMGHGCGSEKAHSTQGTNDDHRPVSVQLPTSHSCALSVLPLIGHAESGVTWQMPIQRYSHFVPTQTTQRRVLLLIIMSLNFATCTWPDLALVVGALARHMVCAMNEISELWSSLCSNTSEEQGCWASLTWCLAVTTNNFTNAFRQSSTENKHCKTFSEVSWTSFRGERTQSFVPGC
jgi:hypothetical protein